jgi:hypothetical protein
MKTFALVVGLAGLVAAQAAPVSRAYTGTITDSMCELGDHSRMRMGPTDVECTNACVEEHDAAFVLSDGRNVYGLSDQKKPAPFAGRKVTVSGTLDAKTKTIQVESIAAAR